MATSDFRHNNLVVNTALPYITNQSPINPTQSYGPGSHDVLTSYIGQAERRPGFPIYTADTFTSQSIVRWFEWQRWDGTYFIIICVTGSTTSKVYKQAIGSDTTFQLIFTDSGSAEPFDFAVSYNFLFFGNGNSMMKYDGSTVTSWGITPPSSLPTISNTSSGNVPSFIGATYIYAYGNSVTGYISDVSGASPITSATSREWTVTVTGTANAYCDQIHVYRTQDGGSVYYELPNSPISNPGATTTTIVDNAADASLSVTQAPQPGVNAVPAPGYGLFVFAGRIWYVANATLYWTAFEEVIIGTGFRPESAPVFNNRSMGKKLSGIGLAGPYLMVLAADTVWRFSGDSLATFTLEGSIDNYGTRNRATICGDKKVLYWLDSSNTVQATDGVNTVDVSIPIHQDLATINHSLASMTVHADGRFRWLVLGDGGASKLRIFDLVLSQWMPPWEPVGGVVSVGGSMSISPGSIKLFLAVTSGSNCLPTAINYSSYQDNSTSYSAALFTNLASIVSISRYLIVNPSARGELIYISIERDSHALSDVLYLIDENPDTGTYISIFANQKTPAGRVNGVNLLEFWYYTSTVKGANATAAQAGRRASCCFKWGAVNSNFALYSFDPVFRVGPGGGM